MELVRADAREVFESYNFREIRLPIFEQTDLFARSMGDETDVVSKEMYTFRDQGGRNWTVGAICSPQRVGTRRPTRSRSCKRARGNF